MSLLKKISVILIVVSALLLASCSGDAGSSSGGGSTPSSTPLNVNLTTSKDKLFTIENYNVDIYEAPMDVTFTASRNADIRVTIHYNDGTSTEPEVTTYPSRKTVTITLDKDCSVDFHAVATDNKASNGAYKSICFNKLRQPSLTVGETSVSSGEVEVVGNQSITIESWIQYPYEGFNPVLVYTTDGSDPKSSPTATSEGMGTAWVTYMEGMTELKAYLKAGDWQDSDVLDVKLNQRVTPAPYVAEAEEGVVTVLYGEGITLSGTEGQVWFTTNMNLTEADIVNAVSSGSWDDSSTNWVEFYTTTPTLVSGNKEAVKFIAKEAGSKYSEPVVYKVNNKLPAPVLSAAAENKNDKTQTLWIYKCAIDGTEFVSNWTNYSLSGGLYEMTVPSGTTVRVYNKKSGFTDSNKTTIVAKNKLSTPTPTVSGTGVSRYQKLELVSPEGGNIKYIADGVEYSYNGYIEVRETTTITYWAEHANFKDSDTASKIVTVTYNVGDIGPSGGIIVDVSNGYFYNYMELAPSEYFYNQIYGYYSKNGVGSKAQSVGASSTTRGEDNTDALTEAMISGRTFASMTNDLKNTVSDPTNEYAAKKAAGISFTRTLHDGRKMTFNNWFLPAIDQLKMILREKRNGDIDVPFIALNDKFWSSTEESNGSAYYAYINSNGVQSFYRLKGSNGYILPVRYF